jgi:hypothetical protein
VVLEFLDFYTQYGSDELKYLVFDSQFTTYQPLRKLEDRPTPIKFLTIRRRGKKIVEELDALVIKVDFDLTMSILAHNLYRLLSEDLPGYTHNTAATLFDKFMMNSGHVHIDGDSVTVVMKKKRNIPALLTALEKFQHQPIAWMHDRKFSVIIDSTS